MEQKKQEARKECEVAVNKDPAAGPLDGAKAQVNIAKTVFDKDGEHFSQLVLKGNISASYELGTVSISVPEEGIMLAARLDEFMQVLFASAGAYRKIVEQANKKQENKDND